MTIISPASDGKNLQVCSRCLYDETVPSIRFDADGVCNFCHDHDALDREYPTGERGAEILRKMAETIRRQARGPYDCIVGVSGGCDSSYLLYKTVELGLKPLAVHFDNTWNSPIATTNIYKMCKSLGVDLFTYVVDNKEYDDIYRSIMIAGVPELECPTDLGFAMTLYIAAKKFNIKYIFEGHSFRTEGVSPLGWYYMDGKYIASMHDKFGRKKMLTYPNMTFARFMYYSVFCRLRRIRPIYYMDYIKSDAMEELKDRFGWEWYGGHHLDNRFTAFYHRYFMVRRFGVDGRFLGHSGLVRSGQMARQDAIDDLAHEPHCDPHLIALVKKRLGFDDAAFESIMTAPRRSWREYPTYKRTFERLRPLFWLMYKFDLVPKSFYMKFCVNK